MEIRIPYGRSLQTADIAQADLCGILEPAEADAASGTEEQLVRLAMAHPIGSETLRELSRTVQRVLIIASDHTRPVPSRIIAPLMLEEIRAGNPAAEVVFLIATGLHRDTSREELIEKFGEDIVAREKIVIHDSYDDEQMVFKGILPSGSPLLVNKWADWAELIVAEGFIEPHFFAGFSGGRKSVLPGIASFKTVCANHCAAFIADDCASTGVLENNPIHRDMLYAVEQVGLRYIVNVALDAQKKVIAAFAGDAVRAHEAGCAFVGNRLKVQRMQGDVAVTSNGGYPLDQNLYQAVKGMTAGMACVRRGGVIILCAECIDGNGGDAFYHYFADASSPRQVWDDIMAVPAGDTRPDQWQAQILAKVLLHARVIMVCDKSQRQAVADMGMLYAESLEEALAEAYRLAGGRRTVVIPDGVSVIIDD